MIILKLVRVLGGVLAHVSVLQHKVFNSHCEFGLIPLSVSLVFCSGNQT